MALTLVLVRITFSYIYSTMAMGPAGFEPATSSARGWHPAKLDNGPRIARCLDAIRIICLLICEFDILGLFGSLEFEKPVTIFLLLLDYLMHHGMNNSYIHHNQYSSFPGIYWDNGLKNDAQCSWSNSIFLTYHQPYCNNQEEQA